MDHTHKKPDLSRIRCFALDMDGTFYIENRLYEGSLNFIRRLKETGRRFVFLTNNSSKSRADYFEKLKGLGVPVSNDELVTSGQATIEYLKEHYPKKSIFLLGNSTLRKEFEQGGLTITDKDPDMVVTAFDTSFDYQKMWKVCDFVRSGLPFIATHPDFNCPVEKGFMPDIGAIHAYINASAGRIPDKIIGKPYREIMDCAFRHMDCKADETAMVGDRLYTDIAVAKNVPGITSILVLTGETKLSDLEGSDIRPHMVFERLADMTPLL